LSKTAASIAFLERGLQSELNHSRIANRRVNCSKIGAPQLRTRKVELRVVEQIEELCAEINPGRFSDWKMLDH
jgi:hypothetical protein